MSDPVPNLRGNGLTTAAFIVGPLLGAVIVIAGIIWQAAKYPDRTEFDQLRNDATLTKQDVAILKIQYAGAADQQQAIKQQLDRILYELSSTVRRRRTPEKGQ